MMGAAPPTSATRPALAVVREGDGPPPPAAPPDDRPEVVLDSASPHDAIDALAALLHLDDGLYVRSKRLVRIVTALAPHEDERAPAAESTPVIVSVEPATLTECVTRHVRIVRAAKLTALQRQIRDQGGRLPPPEMVRALPPPGVVAGLLARGQWPLRHLVAVSETPVLRPDGSLMQAPGYDRATGYVYRPSTDLPRVHDDPSQADAERALEELAEVFVDFPYVDDAARMVPIAAILTILARSAIDGACPGVLFDATAKGSGKTLQCDAVCAVALGRSAARKSYPPDEEELGKVLAGYAVDGARVVLFDNVVREFGGGELDQMITARDAVEVRILGSTGNVRVPWAGMIMASGNNIVLSEDTVRRVLVARLEPPWESGERPGGFVHPHLYDWILAERPRLVVAALTILRAFTRLKFHLDDQPGRKPWESFEAWSRLVPGAIVFAGGADPLLARPRLEQHASEHTRALPTVLARLPDLDAARRGLTAREIVTALYPAQVSDAERSTDGYDDLRDAIEAWTRPKPGSRPSPQQLSGCLRAAAGRVCAGRRLVRVSEPGATVTRWSVARV